MKAEDRDARKAQITQAAYAVLAARGYAGTSMLAIAKRAKASNETLYRWYGDKQGLFRALIVENAAEVRAHLEQGLTADRPALWVIADLGPLLLKLLTSDRAIALNRAAAADGDGVLGQALAESGREAVGPLIAQLIQRAQAERDLAQGESADLLALYLDLLVGDMQMRRAIGVLAAPSVADCKARAELAMQRFTVLVGA